MLYDTRHIYIGEVNENFTLNLPAMTKHMLDLNLSTINSSSVFHQRWEKWLSGTDPQLNYTFGGNLAIVDIRLTRERVDVWRERLTASFFTLIANIGGTLGLCAGVSFLSGFFLLLFFGNAFYHITMTAVTWFWWNVFLGQPKARQMEALLANEAHSAAVEKRRTSERPIMATRHMRAVSRTIRESRKSGVYDPWEATKLQYGLKVGEDHVPNRDGRAFNVSLQCDSRLLWYIC